ncbi:MAG: hypothetical protein QM681_17480, partial [Novosphingobium sp.]
MSTGTDILKSAWRDHVTPGIPATGANEPSKAEIRAGLDELAINIAAAAAGDPEEVEAILRPLVDEAEAWAQSPTPPDSSDPTSKSAKTLAAEAAASATSLSSAINQSDSFRTALLTGVSYIGAGFDQAMLQATKGLLFDFGASIFRVGTVNSATLAGTGALTATRASTAWALNAAGVYQPFAINVLRATDRGLLLEAAATNLCTQPVDFSNAAWQKANGATALAVAGGAPFATATAAYDLTEGTSTIGVNMNASFTPVAGVHTISLHLKRGGRRYAIVQVTGGTSRMYVIDFDSKTWATVVGNNAAQAASITELSDGWFRVSITETLTATLTRVYVHGAAGPASTDRTYTTTLGTVYARASAAQFETGSAPTSPILTGGATRSADTASVTLPSGSGTDLLTLVHSAGVSTLLRSALAAAGTFNLITDGDGSWLGRYISSMSLVPAFDQGLIEKTDGGASPYLVAMNGTYWWNGAAYSTEAEMVKTMGGSGSMGTLFLGGYIAPDAVNLVADADFTTGQHGFVVTNNATGTTEDGYLKMTATGGNAALSRQFQSPAGKAFRVTATMKTVSSVAGSGVRLGLTSYGPGFQTTFQSANSLTLTNADTVMTLTGSSGKADPFYIGMFRLSGSEGASYLKNVVVKEIAPAKDFPSSNVMVEVTGTAPNPLPAATQVLWQADATETTNTAIDRLRVELRTDGTVHLTMQYNGGAAGSLGAQAWDLT